MTIFFSTCGMHPLYPLQSLQIRRHVYHSLVLIYHMTPQQLLLCYANYNYFSVTDEFNSYGTSKEKRKRITRLSVPAVKFYDSLNEQIFQYSWFISVIQSTAFSTTICFSFHHYPPHNLHSYPH